MPFVQNVEKVKNRPTLMHIVQYKIPIGYHIYEHRSSCLSVPSHPHPILEIIKGQCHKKFLKCR
jgi:hypothetical protein